MPQKIDFTNINSLLSGGNVFVCIGCHILYDVVLFYVSATNQQQILLLAPILKTKMTTERDRGS